MSAEPLDVNPNTWIAARIVGIAALGLAGALWIFYMAIAPASESDLESVDAVVSQRWLNRHKGSVTSQNIRAVKSDGDEIRFTIPYFGHGRRKIDIEPDMRVTLKMTEYGNVYAIEGRRGALMTYQDGREFYASRRIIPGILATTATLLAAVMALVSWLGPMLTEGQSRFARR